MSSEISKLRCDMCQLKRRFGYIMGLWTFHNYTLEKQVQNETDYEPLVPLLSTKHLDDLEYSASDFTWCNFIIQSHMSLESYYIRTSRHIVSLTTQFKSCKACWRTNYDYYQSISQQQWQLTKISTSTNWRPSIFFSIDNFFAKQTGLANTQYQENWTNIGLFDIISLFAIITTHAIPLYT